jgi:hypothetical protein
MAEKIVSPGVFQRETDESFISPLPVKVGAAIVGPTVKGPNEQPTVVTSFSEYKQKFGTTFLSGSQTFEFFTSIAAQKYFSQGGDSLLVTRVTSGSFTSAESSNIAPFPPVTASLGDSIFTLKTIGKGLNQNNGTGSLDAGEEFGDGSLKSGSRDNIRWEVSSPVKSNGTFTLEIRRGDDNTVSPIVLETFTGLSLDPESDNYIAKRIGDQYTSITSYDGQSMVVVNGDNPNQSRYVYVSSVDITTPQYLNNDGSVGTDANGNSYTLSLPRPGSGSFFNASGSVIPVADVGNYFENIDSSNTQGLTGSDYTTAINILGNKDEYRFNTITLPGVYNDDYASVVADTIEMCETRGDAFYVADLSVHGSTVGAVTASAAELNTSFAGAYWPWVQTPSTELSRNVWVPASTVIQGVYAFNDRVSAPWFAPAGLNRGGLPVTRAEIKLTQGLRDTLYEAKVNPIATFPNSGVVAYGQKTLQTKASALDRINVRRLLIALKNFIGDTSRNLVFEQNTTVTRNRFLNAVNPYLESVVQRQGLYAFKVTMDETNNTADVVDRNQLVGQIVIQPTKTAEFIILDYVIKPTGASFDE